MFKLNGTIKVIKDTQQITDTFSKREFVVSDTSGMYPQDILFQAVQDRCAMLDGYQPGEQVEVSFNLRGREWTSPQGEVKYFNTLDAWRVERMGQGMPQEGPSNMNLNTQPATETTAGATDAAEDDDLPF